MNKQQRLCGLRCSECKRVEFLHETRSSPLQGGAAENDITLRILHPEWNEVRSKLVQGSKCGGSLQQCNKIKKPVVRAGE